MQAVAIGDEKGIADYCVNFVCLICHQLEQKMR